ncbi:conserved hypothetical protein [Burkholderiales bacterium 8X]|nr:conserved hypothetical protein [Burkholderiales bacterium 8X]
MKRCCVRSATDEVKPVHCREVIWTLLLVGCTFGSNAAELDLKGNRLFVEGTLDGSALPLFKEHLASGKVRTVVFENSIGGSAEVAAEYARAIRAGGLDTEAHGQCHAACAYAFLAGKEHRFGRGFQVNALLIPVGNRPTAGDLQTRWRGEDAHRTLADFTVPAATAAQPQANAPQLSPASLAGTGAELTAVPADVAASSAAASVVPALTPASTAGSSPSAARERWHPDHGVLFTSTPTLFGRVYNAFYCDGTQGRDASRCELLSDADPYKLGVLTP